MKMFKLGLLSTAVVAAMGLSVQANSAETFAEAFAEGTAYGNFRLRFEDVDAGADTDALTLRTKLGFKTAAVNGFSAVMEVEDVRAVLGMSETGNGIPDPDAPLTEVDQAFVQYKNDSVTAKLGRQVLTLDGHRHVGHVGWRQDKQTFDAARVTFSPVKDLKIDLSHVYKVNRINSPHFGDVDVSHNLLNVSYKTPIGKAVAYYYDLSDDGLYDDTATLGFSLNGKTDGDVKFLYAAEYATQENDTDDASPHYLMAEVGVSTSGVTAKLGLESLGSDNGQNFVTPLATVHKFQGWADQFLGGSLFGNIDSGNGVDDMYLSVAGKVAGVKLVGVYHDYDSEAGTNDLGDELNLLAVKKFNKTYSGGLKYADYSAGDIGTDTKKLWVWVQAKF